MQSDGPDIDRLEPLFHEALDLEPAARAAFLDARCAGDADLRARLEYLLDAASAAEDEPFWRHNAIEAEASGVAEELDASIPDRYRLLARIGAGGMGAVYKALRADDEYAKVVAVKIVQASDPRMVERFKTERQILARLEHPGIARLLDGGSTRDGRPFLAMEYVEGVPVDRFVSAKKLPVGEVLALFRKICAAVAYAHSNLVVHRDLKPANILVTEPGEPKLLDFGIAKVLDEGGASRTIGAAMTPDYASPEQVTGAPVTTSSDIYSLGVLLYQLLTGRPLYGAATAPIELTRAIVADAPPSLGPAFDRDLDNIVQMALRKEPERRYASADQLSDDLQRYLDGYPVKAQPATRGYRARKFIGRNRVAVAGAVLLFLIMVAGIAATEWEAHLANERFEDVRELAHSVVFDYHDAIETLPGSTPIRERLVEDALRYLNKLTAAGGGEALQRELAESYIRISRVQGNDYSSNLGDVKGAAETAAKAVAIAEKLVRSRPSAQNRIVLADAYKERADVRYSAGDLEHAAADYRKALSLFEQVIPETPPGDVDTRITAINAYCHLGELLGGEGTTNLGRPAEAMEPYQNALPLAQFVVAQDPDSHVAQKALYTVHLGIALLDYASGRFDAAETANRLALAAIERIAKTHPNSMDDQMEVNVARARLARVLVDNGKAAEAADLELSSVVAIDAQARLDPSNVLLVRNQSLAEWQTGDALLASGAAGRALFHAERAVALTESLRHRNPHDAVVVADLVRRQALLTEVFSALNRARQAVEHGREALHIAAGSPGSEQNSDLRLATVTARLALGEAAFKAGDTAIAFAEFQAAEGSAQREAAATPERFSTRVELAEARAGKAACEARRGQRSDAIRDYRSAMDVWRELETEGKMPPRLARTPQHVEDALGRLTAEGQS